MEGTILHQTRATRADTSIILHAVIPNAQQALLALSSADIKVCPAATEIIKAPQLSGRSEFRCSVSLNDYNQQ